LDPPPRNFLLEFDYELVLNATIVDVDSAVRSLEASILSDLAGQFLQCDLLGNRRAMESRFLQDANENNMGVVQLDSTPIDIRDESKVLCSVGSNFDNEEQCIPYKGSMTYHTICISCPAEDVNLLATIENGCENDAYVDGMIIKKVHYIAQSGNGIPFTINVESTPKEQDDSLPVNLMGSLMIFFIIAAIVAIVGALQIGRRKHREIDEDDELEEDDVEVNDCDVFEEDDSV